LTLRNGVNLRRSETATVAKTDLDTVHMAYDSTQAL